MEHQLCLMPMLALRGLTIFPNVVLHFDVGRQISIRALDEAMEEDQRIFLVAQKDVLTEEPTLDDLYQVGTISRIRQILRLPGDTVRVMVEGESRGRLKELMRSEPSFYCEVEEYPTPEPVKSTPRTEALIRRCYELFERYTDLAPKMTPDVLLNVLSSTDPGYIADYIAQNISLRSEDKQNILEELRPVRRLERMIQILEREIEVLQLEQDMQAKVRDQLGKNQRDYILREQMKAIRSELGEGEDPASEQEEYEKKIKEAKLPEEVETKLRKELIRLTKQPPGSAESSVLRNYLDVCLPRSAS